MGFSYEPRDLIPLSIGGRVHPARWRDMTDGEVLLLSFSKVTDSDWTIKVQYKGEIKSGKFHKSGRLDID